MCTSDTQAIFILFLCVKKLYVHIYDTQANNLYTVLMCKQKEAICAIYDTQANNLYTVLMCKKAIRAHLIHKQSLYCSYV